MTTIVGTLADTANKILTTQADYSMIRQNLGGVSSTQVANAVIEDYGYLPFVEAEIIAVITDYASLTGSNLYRLKTGCAAWVAALLCEYIEREEASHVQIGDYQEFATDVDWRAKAAELMRKAAAALSSISTRTLTRRTALVRAGPTRAKTNVPADLEEWLERIQPRLLDWVEESGEDD